MGILDDTLQRWGVGLLNGGALPAPPVAPPAPFGFAPTTDDMIRQARLQLANQQQNPPPVGDVTPWAPPWIDLGGDHPTGGTAWGNKAADIASKVAYGLMKNAVIGLVTLPKRAFDASHESFAHTFGPGPATISDSDPPWHDPLPAIAAETALTMTGGAGPFAAEANALQAGLRHPFAKDFPNVVVQQPANSSVRIMSHPDYAAAKRGNDAAAARVVFDSLDNRAMDRLQGLIGSRRPTVVPVQASEAGGRNALPVLYARELAERFGLPVDTDIVQANRAFRTGAGADYRMRHRTEFQGAVQPGTDHLLVDDAVTMGGTLADLHSHIIGNHGKVVGATTLMAAPHSHILAPGQATLARLRDKLPQLEPWWKATYGHGLEGLTDSEARHLATFNSTDAIRDRLAP
jgi:hypothetical protein